jgi:hypothetical protein
MSRQRSWTRTLCSSPEATGRQSRIFTVCRRTLTVTVVTAVLLGGSATVAAALPKRPDKADWWKIQAAAQLRKIGLAPDRTAHFRSFAGFMGLTQLREIHPLAPGPCRRALTYLYGNLLDLQDAHPGENWTPLRRLVAREPSIRACAPRVARSSRARDRFRR